MSSFMPSPDFSTITSFAEKLGVMAVEEYKSLRRVEGQVGTLREELEWISSFIRDAAVHRNKSERVDVWVSQVRDLASDAEDVLEIFIHKVKRLSKGNIRWLINYPSRLITLRHLRNQIESINKRIERISVYRSKYAIDKLEDHDLRGKGVAFNKTRTGHVEEGDGVVGFETQSEAVVEMLKNKEESSKLHVVSIVGMPGAGKSTLAHKVFNDIKKENKFDSHAWIDVPQEFDPHEFYKQTIDSLSKEENQGMKDENRGKGENFREKKKKKLLVVFDDVWSKQDWEKLHTHVLKKIRSKEITVLVTSRSSEVARYANSHMNLYNMKKLNEEEGLELLKKTVFHEDNSPNGNLNQVAEKIVEKCQGLPLAIVVLGDMLSAKPKNPDEWNRVLESASWQLLQGSTDCLEAIARSYDSLPTFLKPCFLYFSVFPEGQTIDCEKLILLWIAEGFIHERGEEPMEDVAEDYLKELIQRNMILVEKRRSNGSPQTCRIHFLLREFAISKGQEDKFLDIFTSKGKATPTKSRRHALHSTEPKSGGAENRDASSSNDTRTMPFFNKVTSTMSSGPAPHPTQEESKKNPSGYMPRSPNARSMLCFRELGGESLFKGKSFHKGFGLLRVLDLGSSMTNVERLPDEIGKLILLKYLNLSGAKMLKTLPSSIGNLRNLQTLDISGTEIIAIPPSVYELEELRHLYANTFADHDVGNNTPGCNIIDGSYYNPTGRRRIGRLRNIRTLRMIVHSRISVKGFSRLNNLRKLWLCGEDSSFFVKALSDSKALNFTNLRVLVIEWRVGKLQFKSLENYFHLYKLDLHGEIENFPTDPGVFPPNLIEFGWKGPDTGTGMGTGLEQEEGPMKTLAELKNLKILRLAKISFLGKQMVFPARGFRELTCLEITETPQLEELKVEEGSLPKLNRLHLDRRKSIRGLPDRLQRLTTSEEHDTHAPAKPAYEDKWDMFATKVEQGA